MFLLFFLLPQHILVDSCLVFTQSIWGYSICTSEVILKDMGKCDQYLTTSLIEYNSIHEII